MLLGTLTVRETLRYAALLRMPSKLFSWREMMDRVDIVMEELGLTKSADTVVGIPGVTKGLSGGERKRLCIAVEMLNEPAILFLGMLC